MRSPTDDFELREDGGAWGIGPVCDNCKTPLVIHGSTLAGQFCDLQLAWKDFKRVLREEWESMRKRWGNRL